MAFSAQVDRGSDRGSCKRCPKPRTGARSRVLGGTTWHGTLMSRLYPGVATWHFARALCPGYIGVATWHLPPDLGGILLLDITARLRLSLSIDNIIMYIHRRRDRRPPRAIQVATSMTMSAHWVHTWGACSASSRHESTYAPGATSGTTTSSKTLNWNCFAISRACPWPQGAL